ncbi:hypothetical protein SEA_VANLEE_148 [Gordonia phage VanLee]|uniref:Uncharacterized protein n=1 Tax=Gordonia phage VanLee TaxID=2845816 RepID=A0A8F2IFA8_9CAUD|nr:hypothetical protein QEH49_gp142 [Gordonia phage VanLee]QWS68264.1 hypothetical protein SEA_VANLEE_148 [Gordonia phage VanLee]
MNGPMPTSLVAHLQCGDRLSIDGFVGDYTFTTITPDARGRSHKVTLRNAAGKSKTVAMSQEEVVALLPGSPSRHRVVEVDLDGTDALPYRACCNQCRWQSEFVGTHAEARRLIGRHFCLRGVEVIRDNNHGYPYRAWCQCGWRSPGYAARHAAESMMTGHTCQ